MVVKSLFPTVIPAWCNAILFEPDTCAICTTSLTHTQQRHQQYCPCYLTLSPAPGEDTYSSWFADGGSTGATGLACIALCSLLTLASIPRGRGSSLAVHDTFLNALYSLVLSLPITVHLPLLGKRKHTAQAQHVCEDTVYGIQSLVNTTKTC